MGRKIRDKIIWPQSTQTNLGGIPGAGAYCDTPRGGGVASWRVGAEDEVFREISDRSPMRGEMARERYVDIPNKPA
jgi:hypothetical protein